MCELALELARGPYLSDRRRRTATSSLIILSSNTHALLIGGDGGVLTLLSIALIMH